MKRAKVFQHGGSQAVRLPKEFRFDGSEVAIEKRGNGVLLKPVPARSFKTLAEVARHYGDIRADLERRGVSIGPLDMLIALHARSLGAVLVTGHVAEFSCVRGLEVVRVSARRRREDQGRSGSWCRREGSSSSRPQP